jgi:hypothetical protein
MNTDFYKKKLLNPASSTILLGLDRKEKFKNHIVD